MKNRKSWLYLAACVALIAGCSSAPKLAPDQRQAQFIVETPGVSRADGYGRAKVWFSKTFNNSNHVIRNDDKEAGRIVGKGNAPCDALKQFGDVNGYLIEFVIDSTSKDGKTRLLFEDLNMIPERAGNAFVANIDDAGDLQKVKSECLQPIADSFKAAMTSATKKNDDF